MRDYEENLVIEVEEEITEEVEETTEESEEQVEQEDADESTEEKLYTQKEFEAKLKEEVDGRVDKIVGKRLARQEAKIRKEYEKETELARVIKAGTGEDDLENAANAFREHYKQKGIDIPARATTQYSERDLDVLAAAEANEFIQDGFEEVEQELNRLTELGTKNMTPREKKVYLKLADYHAKEVQMRELASIGVSKDVYESVDFKAFASQFTDKTPMKMIYDIYSKTREIPPAEKIGSLKNGQPKTERDVYTPEEVDKLTEKDFEDPKVMEKVRRSMLRW